MHLMNPVSQDLIKGRNLACGELIHWLRQDLSCNPPENRGGNPDLDLDLDLS